MCVIYDVILGNKNEQEYDPGRYGLDGGSGSLSGGSFRECRDSTCDITRENAIFTDDHQYV